MENADMEIQIHNVINALFYFIKQSPVNWEEIETLSDRLSELVDGKKKDS